MSISCHAVRLSEVMIDTFKDSGEILRGTYPGQLALRAIPGPRRDAHHASEMLLKVDVYLLYV